MNAPFRKESTPTRARLTVDDFLLLNDSGAFADYSKTELIEGEIWCVNAQHSRHARTKTNLGVMLSNALRDLGSPLRPIIEASTRVSDHSLPEPDIVVTSYTGPHVVPLESVALVAEVSDTTVDIDMGRKLRVYSAAGIAEHWVVDVEARVIHQLWAPSGDVYAERRPVPLGERVEAVTVAGLAVQTDALE